MTVTYRNTRIRGEGILLKTLKLKTKLLQETFPLTHMGKILVDYFGQQFHPKAYKG